ncbi:UvrD-helicase domain-containing protein [Desulfurella amilsii]|nr:ATP-dependent helicase [Desulfurella amilsii]
MAWNDSLDEGSPVYNLAISNERVIRSLAGPGSGKSFAIKRRISRLIEEGVNPKKILAITFTRTSASDLRKEISSIELPGSDEVVACTVHSHAMSIIAKANVKDFTGRNPRMIIDHEIEPAFRDIKYPPDADIKTKKEYLDLYLSAWANMQQDDPGLPRNQIEQEFQDKIIQWLTYHHSVLVGEVIPIAIKYLQNNPASPEIGRFDTILVDEYQDLNKAEQEFIHLVKGDASILIVGDDDQSIYSFKKAHPEGIKQIDSIYGEFQDIAFDTIRRCPKTVTRMASELISKNSNRSLGALVPFEANQDGIVQIVQFNDNDKEIEGICRIVKNELASGAINPGDVLILAPRRHIGYRLRDKLISEEIPVKSYFRESVIKNLNVRMAYSTLYLLANPNDQISLRYLLGSRSADYRKRQYDILKEYADGNKTSIKNVLDKVIEGKIILKGISKITKKYREILQSLLEFKEQIKKDAVNALEYFINGDQDEIDFYEIIGIYQRAINKYPYPEVFTEELFSDWLSKIVKELSESIAQIDSPEEINHVRIMSLHASKGLSAKLVILVSMIDELIPFFSEPPKDANEELRIIEEQRRLFYVAITRTKSSTGSYPGRLIISSYIWIDDGIEALKMGLKARSDKHLRVSATRYISDFGRTSPKTILGEDLT